MLLAAVSGALRRYLPGRGEAPSEIRAMVPFNLRPLDEPIPRELGNQFGLVFLPLPGGTSGGYRRLQEVHRRMEEIKNGREGPVSYARAQADRADAASRSSGGSSTCSRPRAPR